MQIKFGNRKLIGLAIRCPQRVFAQVLLSKLAQLGWHMYGNEGDMSPVESWDTYGYHTCYLLIEGKEIMCEPGDCPSRVCGYEMVDFRELLVWTEQDLTIARGRIAEGRPIAARYDDDKALRFYDESLGKWSRPGRYDLLPQIRPGMIVDLREVVNEYSRRD